MRIDQENQVWNNQNKLIGYMDENYILYGINAEGFADEICELNDTREIRKELVKWRKANGIAERVKSYC